MFLLAVWDVREESGIGEIFQCPLNSLAVVDIFLHVLCKVLLHDKWNKYLWTLKNSRNLSECPFTIWRRTLRESLFVRFPSALAVSVCVKSSLRYSLVTVCYYICKKVSYFRHIANLLVEWWSRSHTFGPWVLSDIHFKSNTYRSDSSTENGLKIT